MPINGTDASRAACIPSAAVKICSSKNVRRRWNAQPRRPRLIGVLGRVVTGGVPGTSPQSSPHIPHRRESNMSLTHVYERARSLGAVHQGPHARHRPPLGAPGPGRHGVPAGRGLCWPGPPWRCPSRRWGRTPSLRWTTERPDLQPAARHQRRRQDRRLLRLRRPGHRTRGTRCPARRAGEVRQRELARLGADPGHRPEQPRRDGRLLVARTTPTRSTTTSASTRSAAAASTASRSRPATTPARRSTSCSA